jgi:6-phosphogluconolactonase (cycloisomerase 2 family)
MAHLFHRNPAATARTPKPLVALALTALTLGLSSCGAFFQCEGKASCPATTSTSTSCTAASATTVTGTIYGYVTNSTCGNDYLNGYTLSGGALSAATGFPFNLAYVPSAVAISQANTFMYVASDSANPLIFGYSISTGGQVTVLNGGNGLYNEDSVALETSPDGKYLFSLNADGATIEQYSINTTSGALTFVGNYAFSGLTSTPVPTALKFAPSGEFLVATLGTGGAEIFPYIVNTTAGTGALDQANAQPITPTSSSVGIYGVAVDSKNYVYLSLTSAVNVYSTTSVGVPTFVKSYAVGNGAHQAVLNPAGSLLYVANFSDGTISAFSVASGGVLTAITGSPFSGPSNVIALGITSNGNNLIASGYNTTNGLQLFSIGPTGALTEVGSTGTDASTIIPAVVATTH